MDDVIDYLENHDMEKWAWDVEDLCSRIDKIVQLFKRWNNTRQDKYLFEMISEIEELSRVW